jgi:hypothetical protein
MTRLAPFLSDYICRRDLVHDSNRIPYPLVDYRRRALIHEDMIRHRRPRGHPMPTIAPHLGKLPVKQLRVPSCDSEYQLRFQKRKT